METTHPVKSQHLQQAVGLSGHELLVLERLSEREHKIEQFKMTKTLNN